MGYRWILFCPKLASTPSSPRVMVWRRMHSVGSVGLDNGLWILPHTPESEQFVQEMKAYVESQGGSSRVFLVDSLDAATEEEILTRFREDRAMEYGEVMEQCIDFLAEIGKEINRQNLTFAEYEENEEDLRKLESWFEKVKKRDILAGKEAEEASEGLEKCRQALQCFADEVFNHEKE